MVIKVGTKFKLKPTGGHAWYDAHREDIFEVCEGYDETHFQIPAMTKYGRTWFNRENVEILED